MTLRVRKKMPAGQWHCLGYYLPSASVTMGCHGRWRLALMSSALMSTCAMLHMEPSLQHMPHGAICYQPGEVAYATQCGSMCGICHINTGDMAAPSGILWHMPHA